MPNIFILKIIKCYFYSRPFRCTFDPFGLLFVILFSKFSVKWTCSSVLNAILESYPQYNFIIIKYKISYWNRFAKYLFCDILIHSSINQPACNFRVDNEFFICRIIVHYEATMMMLFSTKASKCLFITAQRYKKENLRYIQYVLFVSFTQLFLNKLL